MRYAGRWRTRVALGVPAGLAVLLLVVPLVALLLRADWARIPGDLATPTVLPALRLSLTTTTSTAALCLVLGTPLAWFLARSDHPATSWVRALLTVPLVLPPVVGGVALLMTWGRNGLLGQHLTPFGVQIPFTTVAVVLAETFVLKTDVVPVPAREIEEILWIDPVHPPPIDLAPLTSEHILLAWRARRST